MPSPHKSRIRRDSPRAAAADHAPPTGARYSTNLGRQVDPLHLDLPEQPLNLARLDEPGAQPAR
jgi:hypothetical protein